jgi:Haem-binding domain
VAHAILPVARQFCLKYEKHLSFTKGNHPMADQPQAISEEQEAVPQPPAPKKRRRWLSVLLIILGLLILAFIGIQFIPVSRTNPQALAPIQWDSPQTQALARQACMDCHSNETVWPWYSHIAPVSWLAYYDVMRGRSELNFSTLGSAQGQAPGGSRNQPQDLAYRLGQLLAGGSGRGGPGGGDRPPEFNGGQPQGGEPTQSQGFPAGGFGGRLAERISEAIQSGKMPPAKYTLIHSGARLSSEQLQQLLKGLEATFGLSAQ